MPHDKKKPWKWNKRRTFSVALFGAVWGGTAHYWYHWLDSKAHFYFPHAVYRKTAFKVALDMLIFEPFSVGLFFVGVGILEGRKYEQIKGKIVDSFLPTIAVDFVVWPTITYYVFLKIPVNWQVIAFASMDFFYDSFLSIVQHNDVFRDIWAAVKRCIIAPCKICSSDASTCSCGSSPSPSPSSISKEPSSSPQRSTANLRSTPPRSTISSSSSDGAENAETNTGSITLDIRENESGTK